MEFKTNLDFFGVTFIGLFPVRREKLSHPKKFLGLDFRLKNIFNKNQEIFQRERESKKRKLIIW